MNNNEAAGQRIKEVRIKNGISQSDVMRLSNGGISRSFVSRIESGERGVHPEMFLILMKVIKATSENVVEIITLYTQYTGDFPILGLVAHAKHSSDWKGAETCRKAITTVVEYLFAAGEFENGKNSSSHDSVH